MDSETPEDASTIYVAIVTEAVLALVALLLGWICDVPVLNLARERDWTSLGMHWAAGSLVAAGLFAIGVGIQQLPLPGLQELKQIVEERVWPLFRAGSPSDLMLLALLAGVGEELLFRGFLQQWLAGGETSHLHLAVWGAAVAFGACHFLTWTYFLVATVIGAVLGYLFIWTGGLLAPILAHFLYDWFMLLYMRRVYGP